MNDIATAKKSYVHYVFLKNSTVQICPTCPELFHIDG